MLHGGPGGTSKSFYQFASLGEDRPVIIFDQLGSGRSGYHTDTALLKVENFVEQVEALKTSLGIKRVLPARPLLGYSLSFRILPEIPKRH